VARTLAPPFANVEVQIKRDYTKKKNSLKSYSILSAKQESAPKLAELMHSP
jgi:hypothetical protein